jgi:hypothetical protein
MFQSEIDGGHHAGYDNALHILHFQPAMGKQVMEQYAVLVAGIRIAGGHTPILYQFRPVKKGGLNVGIAYVHGENHDV